MCRACVLVMGTTTFTPLEPVHHVSAMSEPGLIQLEESRYAQFDDLYRREFPGLIAVATALSGDDGEDLVQDAMVKALMNWDLMPGFLATCILCMDQPLPRTLCLKARVCALFISLTVGCATFLPLDARHAESFTTCSLSQYRHQYPGSCAWKQVDVSVPMRI